MRIWHAHITWLSNYRFSESGKIETRISADKKRFSEVAVLEEAAMIYSNITSEEKRQALITQQAIELDADSCALSMIINMLIKDAHVRYERGIIKDTEEYITSEVGLIMGALATAFSLFDGCSGAKFDLLEKDLDNMNHPIPAIRMFVAEEVADGMLWKYYEEPQKHFRIEREWQHIVCDVEPYYNGQVDMGRVFYYTAYTEKAQKHLTKLRYRLKDMRDTLEKVTLCSLAEELEDEDIEFDPQVIWFSDTGKSLRGWINPATGDNPAIKRE